MLGRVWLLGPHKIYPFSLPTAMAQEAVSAWLSLAQLVSAGRDHPVSLYTPSPQALAPPRLPAAPGDRRTPVQSDSARGQQTLSWEI